MPKEGAMTQISRPFQIALVAVVLIAAAWFVALRGHSTSSSSSSASSAPALAASSASASSGSAASGSAASQSASGSTGSAGSASSGAGSTYHGSAPGVDGLTRAIQKAHGAVAESEQNAKALQQKSEEAAGGAQAQSAGSTGTQAAGGSSTSSHQAATSGGTAPKRSAAKTRSAAAKTTSQAAAPKTTETKSASGIPAMQARVEAQLKQGKVAALLFWNPKGSDDRAVRNELRSAAGKLHGKLAIDVAPADQVGSFGSFTRTVQVYGTPTILLINPAGKTASVTGLTDAFSIAQAVREVQHAK
jgi:hypothetical protein